MRENGDTLQESSVLLDIHLIMNEVDGLEWDATWVTLNTENQNRLNEINAGTGSNALSGSHNLSRFGQTDDSMTTKAEYLHRLELFESNFPDFDVPFHRLFMYSTASAVALKFGKTEMNSTFESKKSLAWANCPVSTALQSWSYRGKEMSTWPPNFFAILYEWMKLDCEKGSLLGSDVVSLLLLKRLTARVKRQQTTSLPQACNRVKPMTLQVECMEPLSRRCQRLGATFGNYKKWLWDSPSEVEQSLRHTILLDMQQ